MLSLILPVRNWPDERVAACLQSFLRLKSKALTEIVVVDFGSDEPIRVAIRDKRVRLIRVEAERWSLAEANNVGVIASTNPVLAKTDADILIAREAGPALDAAVAAIVAGRVAGGVVQATDLPEGIESDTALAATTVALNADGRLRPRWGQGGLCLFSADAWNAIGGFESRFHGWGNEDNDFADRLRRSGRKVGWLDEIQIFHVWHPPTYVAKHIFQAREANRKLYLDDKSTFRSIRFLHTKRSSLPAPNVSHAPRPLVTIAFASKARPGRERMLMEALRGFAGQIDNDFEIVVADNGSTPEERETLGKALAKAPKGMHVRILDIEKPSIPATRNRITDEARGRYICIADDDDIPLPKRLSDHLAVFSREPAVHGSHGGWIDFDELTGLVEANTGGERNLSNFLFGPGRPSAHPASLFRTDVMRAVRYDESIRFGSDYDLATRMANMGLRVEHTRTYVVLRRFHQTNVTIGGLSDQLSVASMARSRVVETLGPVYESRVRDLLKSTKLSIWCNNMPGRERLLAMLPAYCGTWRLLVPLSGLGLPSAMPSIVTPGDDSADDILADGFSPGGSNLATRAQDLANLLDGDIGVVDPGVDPGLFYISVPIKGARKALKLKATIEATLDIEVEIVPDVEFQRRHSTPFDWSKLPRDARNAILVSQPIRELDKALAALASLPHNTALRAMTSIVADYNCTDRLYRLVTTPILTEGGPARARTMLERQTGERFETIADAGLRH